MSEMIRQKTVKIADVLHARNEDLALDRSMTESTHIEPTNSTSTGAVTSRHILKLAPKPGSKHLKMKLGLRPDQPIDTDKALELSALLIEFVCVIEPVLAGTWEKLSPQSKLRLPRHFNKRVHRFLTKRDTSHHTIAKELRCVRWFLSAIVAAIARAGDNFAVRFSDSLSPSAISSIVKSEIEGEGFFSRQFKDQEICCWQKYCELMDEMTQETISRNVQQAVREYVETFIKTAVANIREKKPC